VDMLTVGTQIHNNAELTALPAGTILVDDKGNSLRVAVSIHSAGQKIILEQTVYGENMPAEIAEELDPTITYDSPYIVIFVR